MSLPVYAWALNLMARVWQFLNQYLTCHRFWDDVDGLQAAAATLLRKTSVHFHTGDPTR